MGRLSLQPAPTFKLEVGIPVPGGEDAPVEFTFKYRTGEEITAWVKANEDKNAAETVLDIALGWNLDDAYTPENVERLCNAYGGAQLAIFSAYLRELRGVRAKN